MSRPAKSVVGHSETNARSSEMTASPLKADILVRLGGVSSVPITEVRGGRDAKARRK
jgi:hypothetical protein